VKSKRKKIWIDSFQTYLSLRLALYFAVYMIAVWAWVVLDRITGALLEARFGHIAVYWSVVSASVVVFVGLLFIYDMLRFSHRFAGPVYRLRNCLKAIVDGEELALMNLRKDDFLQDLKDEFNEMLKALEQRGAVTLKTNEVNEGNGLVAPGPR
jgi:hypothetical protein